MKDGPKQISMFSSEERPAKVSRWLDFAKDSKTREETSHSHTLQLLNDTAPVGWYGKTSPAYCPLTKDEILAPSSGAWANSGMGSRTGFLTLSTSEFHSAAAVCSLSDVLETGEVQQKYFLSQKACKGILRRAGKRGKKLPPALDAALRAVAESTIS